MATSPSPSDRTGKAAPRARGAGSIFTRAARSMRAVTSATIFFLKLFPMLPSGAVDWVTRRPVVEKVRYPTRSGYAEGDLYRPEGAGYFPGMVVCLGVVPFGVDHPQVPVLGRALARAGFAALLYWSPAMREFQLHPDDLENLPLAYHWLTSQPNVDPTRSGLLGTCVGGSFTLMAAASPLIRDDVSFIGAYAPFSSMSTFARDIASATRSTDGGREPWKVDQLTRRVFVHSVTALLDPDEAQRLRSAFVPDGTGSCDPALLSADGRAVYALLTAAGDAQADAALRGLPAAIRERLETLSPMKYLQDIHAPLIVLLHDRGDQVIPVEESRRLFAALRAHGDTRYTEMQFQHLDPVKGKLPLPRLMRELGKFLLAVYPIFRQAVGAP